MIAELIHILGESPWQLTILFFTYGGAFLILGAFLYMLITAHNEKEKSKKKKEEIKYILLAIDIPRVNTQGLMAVEHVFVALSSSIGHTISFELISIEGYIQFLVRCPVVIRDLIEAALFAQYPDAEIAEVRDYMDDVPKDVHEIESSYTVWANDFVFKKESYIPIKTFSQISDKFDPISSIIENLSKIRTGEMVALQFIITPQDSKWNEDGKKFLAGLKSKDGKPAAKEHTGDKFVQWVVDALWNFSEWILSFGIPAGSAAQKKEEKTAAKDDDPYLQQVAKGVAEKISQYAFKTKMRLLYIAHKKVYSKERGIVAIIGALNQFNSLGLNSIVPSSTSVTEIKDAYFKVPEKLSAKQGEMVRLFKERSMGGDAPMIMTGQELATMYHFPAANIKATLIKTVEAAKSSAPVTLPIGDPSFDIQAVGKILPGGGVPMAIINDDMMTNKEYEHRYDPNAVSPGLPVASELDVSLSARTNEPGEDFMKAFIPSGEEEDEEIMSKEGQDAQKLSLDYNPDTMFNLDNKK